MRTPWPEVNGNSNNDDDELSTYVDTEADTVAQSNSTRAKQLELHIQNRVAAELARLEERETQLLADIEARIPAQADGDGKDDAVRELSRQKVRAEIEELRTRLHDMPQQGTLSKDVQAARDDVVKCLRSNDSRPLECWQQVEAFKKQVQAMERRFVSKTVGREY